MVEDKYYDLWLVEELIEFRNSKQINLLTYGNLPGDALGDFVPVSYMTEEKKEEVKEDNRKAQ